MSLVDYAASSDEDDPETPVDEEGNEQVKENPPKRHSFGVPSTGPSSSVAPPNDEPVHAHNRMSMNLELPSRKEVEIVSDHSSELKLPDASSLLNSAAVPSIAEGAARKRGLNGSRASLPRSKVPKGTLPHPKSVPDTVGGRLLPPQLTGRSNVVTEDITKLFVRKHANSSPE